MTFTSYAQNFEDVMLWRALGHVPNGRYIDVGAQHPVIDSVSKGFYEKGWRGTHIEPVPQFAELLRQDRPDETVLQMALSDKEGMLQLHMIPDTGLSTAVKAFAERHKAERNFAYQTISVPMLTMKTALASLAGQQIHWLKIDVEGFEKEVLLGWDSAALRPWIILIEAVVPLSHESNYEEADSVLIQAGYRFAYFDGLNRFYVAKEHSELLAAFRAPPNIFDDVQLSGYGGHWCRGVEARHELKQHEMEQRLVDMQEVVDNTTATAAERIRVTLAELNATHAEMQVTHAEMHATRTDLALVKANAEARIAQAEMRAAVAEGRAAHADLHTTVAAHQLQAVLSSNSWRITAPIRWLSGSLRRVASAATEGRIGSGLKRRAATALRASARGVARRPALKRLAVKVLDAFPGVRQRLQPLITPVASANEPHAEPESNVEDFSPRTQEIYAQLRLALDKEESN